ncbi:MAG: hypothetical protein QE263_08815 [Vampirovibrionales bacterium]|nr:hypothetical protein [Vampirovibrionales bacterium]
MIKILTILVPTLIVMGTFYYLIASGKLHNLKPYTVQIVVSLLVLGGIGIQGVQFYQWTQYKDQLPTSMAPLRQVTFESLSEKKKSEFIDNFEIYMNDVEFFVRSRGGSKHQRLSYKQSVLKYLTQVTQDKKIDANEFFTLQAMTKEKE